MTEDERIKFLDESWSDDNTAGSTYVLRLYVTGSTPKSRRAIENLHQICEEHLKGRYDLEIVDIYQDSDAARDAQIVAAPTLIKQLPEPLRRVIGDLSDREKVLAGLNLIRAPRGEDGT